MAPTAADQATDSTGSAADDADTQQRVLVRNLALANASSYLEYFFGLLVSMLIARSLGPEEYGTYVFLIWLITIAVAFTNEGLSLSITKHVAERTKSADIPSANKIITFFERNHLSRIAIATLPLMVAAFWSSQASHGYTFAAATAIALSVCFFMRARYMLRISAFKGLENFWGVALASFIVTPINLISAITLFLLQAPLWTYLLQYVIVSLSFYLCTAFFLFRRVGYHTQPNYLAGNTNYFERVTTYNRYITPSAILTYLMASQTEIFFLRLFGGTEMVAFFSIGFVLATAIAALVPGIINTILLPMISKSMSRGLDVVRGIVEDTLRYQLYLNFLVIGPTLLYAEELVVFLFTQEYLTAGRSFFWMVLIFCGANFVSAFNSYLLAADEHKLILKVSIYGAIFGLICDLILIYFYGLNGAIIALGLTMAWYVVTRIVPANRKLKARLRWSHLLIVIVACAVCTLVAHQVSSGFEGIVAATIGSTLYVIAFTLIYYLSPVLPNSGRLYLKTRLAGVT